MNSSLLHQLHSSLVLPSRAWNDQSPDGLEKIVVCKVSQESSSSAQPLCVTYSLTVNLVFVKDREVTSTMCDALASFPSGVNL